MIYFVLYFLAFSFARSNLEQAYRYEVNLKNAFEFEEMESNVDLNQTRGYVPNFEDDDLDAK